MIDHGSRSTWGPGSSGSGFRAQKIWSAPTKTDLPYNFCFIKIFPSLTVAAVDALQTLFRAPWPLGVHPGGQNIAYDLALLKLGPHTKFGEDWSNGLAVHLIQTDRQLDKYILDCNGTFKFSQVICNCKYIWQTFTVWPWVLMRTRKIIHSSIGS
jgi:hypothetical protein